jgi:hypothetical protein
MKFLLLEQKYLELLESGMVHEALACLREELTVMEYDTDRVHQLSHFIMCESREILWRMAKWEGPDYKMSSRKTLMDRLQKFFPPSVMLPPDR